MIGHRIGACDPALAARVIRVTPLIYTSGADAALDRPAHVRAGSSLARFGHILAVVQDDANFVAIIDTQTQETRAIELPVGEGGVRQFDDLRGNKRFKCDFEACVAVAAHGADALLAFGSGSSPLRERVMVIRDPAGASPQVTVAETPELYAALRAAQDFAGSDMNIEGAVMVGDQVRLFGRGNGVARGTLLPLDATCDLAWPALWAYLQSPRAGAPPQPQTIVQYQLGELAGLRLGFTDAASGPGALIFSAAAEDSPDATRDGPVAGSVLGVFDTTGQARWTALCDADGERFTGKVEGVALMPDRPYRAYVVVDRDDPGHPSELCEVELAGSWYSIPT